MPGFFSPATTKAGEELDWRGLARTAEAAWSVPQAFYCILLSAAAGDGAISHEAQEELLALAHRSRALKTLSGEEMFQVNAAVVERLLREGDRTLREACAALPPDMRASAFAHALDIVLSDGDLSEHESKFLNTLMAHLELDVTDVRAIADVIIMKNKY
jgi:tellurite resistance protein